MSRDTSLPSGVVAAATAASYGARHAVEIALATPLRLCEGPGSLTVGGATYDEGLLGIGGVPVGASPTLSLRVRNTANEISGPDADADLVRAAGVTLYEVLWNPATGEQLAPVTLFVGVVDKVSYQAGVATLDCLSRVLGNETAGMVGRYVAMLCNHTFKGQRCGYVGAAASCAHTIAACQALANLARFGGFPSVPAIGTLFRYKVASGSVLPVVAGTRSNPATPVPPPVSSGVRRHLGRA